MAKGMKYIMLGISIFACGCDNRWDGVYYPQGFDRGGGYWQSSPKFRESSDCLDWCIAQLEKNTDPKPDCLCGKNCNIGSKGLADCQEVLNAYSF